MKLYEALETQLKTENNFVTDNGELKKWVVINKAQNFDADLIALLLDNKELKEKFFLDIKGTLVFNQNLFVQFLEQKNYLNDSYTQYKNKVGLTLDGKYLKQRNEVALVWPFKDCVLEGGQSREEDKREEIFFNEILAQDEITQLLEPKVLTNAKTFDKDGEHEFKGFTRDAELNKKRGLPKDTITDNLIIKGNNLLALHSLKKEFTGKVKLIYIDPPFNTGNDSFQYNDSFNHSTWLTFMKNRLVVAKELLKEDGLIFINVDDIEAAYLKVLCDEIYGRDKFINTISVRSSTASGMKTAHRDKTIIKQKDTILVYKNSDKIRLKAQYTKKETWDTHYNQFLDKKELKIYSLKEKLVEQNLLNEKQSLSDIDINNKEFIKFYIKHKDSIYQTAPELPVEIKKESRLKKDKVIQYGSGMNINYAINGRRMTFISKTLKPIYDNQIFREGLATLLCDFWNDIDFQNTQNEGGVSFPGGKKPELLLSRIIEMTTDKNDIVLDYHLGSGTTNAVALKSKRQFIGIEQLDYGENDSVKRLKNVINGEQSGVSKAYDWQGGGFFTYLELKKYNQTFIDQIEEAKTSKNLLEIWEQMKAKSFLDYNVDIQKQDEHIADFKKMELAQQKQHLIELLDKNQLYVNLSSLNDKDFDCTAQEKQVTKDFYKIKKD